MIRYSKYFGKMFQSDNGDWVTFDDYDKNVNSAIAMNEQINESLDKLKNELEHKNTELEMLEDTVRQLQQYVEDQEKHFNENSLIREDLNNKIKNFGDLLSKSTMAYEYKIKNLYGLYISTIALLSMIIGYLLW